MVERGYGRILFTSSVAALTGGVIGPHYAASKAALHGLTHDLAARAAADGVTVNAIAPALIAESGDAPRRPGELAATFPVGPPRPARGGRRPDARASWRNGYLTNKVVRSTAACTPDKPGAAENLGRPSFCSPSTPRASVWMPVLDRLVAGQRSLLTADQQGNDA